MGTFITVKTHLHRYIVRRDQVIELRTVTSHLDIDRPDERGKPVEGSELGPLLDPRDTHTTPRRHALVAPTRRKSVALLVERIEDLHTATLDDMHKLPRLLIQRLERPWFLGVLVDDDIPMLVLDLRQIAQDVLIMKSQERKARAQEQEQKQTQEQEQTQKQKQTQEQEQGTGLQPAASSERPSCTAPKARGSE